MTESTPDHGVSVGLYGKHPSFGDFVTNGLPETAQATLEQWLHHVMPAIRESWGDSWGPLFEASPIIRFWFGGTLVGEVGPIFGVMAPSRDTVGRRFPLAAAVAGSDQPAPVQSGDQQIYVALADALRSFVRDPGTGASDFTNHVKSHVAQVLPPPAAAIEPDFWAARGDGDLDRLWGDVAEVDHSRAAAARSYLWCEGPGGAAVHVTRGLPDAPVLAWLMTDAVRAAAPAAVPMPTLEDAAPMADPVTDKTVPPAADNNDNTVSPVDLPQMTD